MFRIRAAVSCSKRRTLATLPSYQDIQAKFTFSKQASSIEDVLSSSAGRPAVINGWIDRKPKQVGKGLVFGSLRDTNGDKIQLVDSQALLKQSHVEDAVQVEGKLVQKRLKEDAKTPEYEIQLTGLRTLNASNVKTAQMQECKVSESYPPEYRHLQLRLPAFQARMKMRHNASKAVRASLEKLGFMEVETPLLFKSTPEGAREFLVPTRHKQGKDPLFYALPQSPQQYKQLLMAGGVQKYYQLARCFRDEDLRSDRQPEFTQVDLEMAFANGDDVMRVVESTVLNTWNEVALSGKLHTLDKAFNIVPCTPDTPVSRLTYHQVMTQYGIDKPDLRFKDLKIVDLSEFNVHGHTHKQFPVFEILILRNAFDSPDDFQKHWNHLNDPNEYNYRAPIVVPITDTKLESNWFESFLPIANFENPKLVAKFFDLKQGDIVCGATRERTHELFENPTPLGRLRQLVIRSSRGKELYQSTDKDVACWVIDFPLFAPEEASVAESRKPEYPAYDAGRLCSMHHPFTMVRLQDYQKLSEKPLSCLGQHYDLVVNGVELGGGSTRVHDPVLQRYIFNHILKITNEDEVFGHLLEAFSMGTPPHAGFAIGFDRMVAMMCSRESIRDVIAFPKSVTGSDLLVRSPSVVPETTLAGYNIAPVTRKP
ncbi:AaceriAGR206Cp [[Ashbya] aceris (nom. inval.)]|nr:AaceriAGR206Cp [[Ashbya] aceris (nom. inval.)]